MATSQLGAHAEYVKGATVEAIGSLSGSKEWTESGADTKEHAIQDMRSAAAAAPSSEPHSSTLGAVEKRAGELVGCEGMVQEGEKSAPHAVAEESTVSSTVGANELFDHSKQV